jgi:DME family drug/metabolite transporter
LRPSLAPLFVLAAACSWGTWSLWFRPTGLPGSVTAPVVFALVALGSAPLVWRERRGQPPLGGSALGWLALYGALDAVNAATFFSAMNTTTVAVAVLTHDLAPVFVALAAPRVEGVRVPGARGAAALALVGVALLLTPWRPGALGGQVLLGASLGLVSAVAYACNVFVGRRLASDLGPATALGGHAAFAALVLAPLAAPHLGRVELGHLPYLAVAGLGPGLFAGLAFLRGSVLVGSARAAVLAFAEPLVACAVGAVAFGEPLGAWGVAGGACILAAGLRVTLRSASPSPLPLASPSGANTVTSATAATE